MIYTINESDIAEKVKDKVNRTRSKLLDTTRTIQHSISKSLYDRYERAGKVPPDIKEKRDSILADNQKRYDEQRRRREEQRRRYEEERNRALSNKNNQIQESTIFDNIEIV